MQTQQIRRRANGTIDIDSYRQDALVLRVQATRRILNKVRRLLWPLIGVVAVVAAHVAFLPRTSAPPSTSSMLVSAGIAATSSD